MEQMKRIHAQEKDLNFHATSHVISPPLPTLFSPAPTGNINHSYVLVRGLNLHVAEIGNGPNVVLFLHGFPEIWYSWRHQMIGAANAGYRAIAIDFRGYGLSDQPSEPEKGTFMDLVADIIALLDTLGISKVFVVGKDFGAVTAHLVAVLHPERVRAVISLGVPFLLPSPDALQLDLMPTGFYFSRWQEPGRAEADFDRFDAKTVVKNVYILFSRSESPVARDDQEVMDLVEPSTPLPPWFSEEDLQIYASSYDKSGFRYGLQVPYRALKIDCGVKDPKVEAPTLLIMGEKDLIMSFVGMDDYVRSEKAKQFVPNLETVFMEEGCHFANEQLPDEVNQLIINFLDEHTKC